MTYAAPRPPAAVGAPGADVAVPDARYVGLVTRALAFAVDAAVINLVAVLATAVTGLTLSVLSLSEEFTDVLVVIGGGLYVLWSIGYFVVFWSTTGQTPGARLFRFQVRTAALGPLRPRRALLRFAALTLAALPLFAGFLPILVDDRRRGLHDMLAGTVVTEMTAAARAALDARAP
jgi:uncharacterized RDD family membrane protein YckC